MARKIYAGWLPSRRHKTKLFDWLAEILANQRVYFVIDIGTAAVIPYSLKKLSKIFDTFS
jgi:hypothetical protein